MAASKYQLHEPGHTGRALILHHLCESRVSNPHPIDCETAQRLMALASFAAEPAPPTKQAAGTAACSGRPHPLVPESGLSPGEQLTLEAHIAGCPGCQTEFAATETLFRELALCRDAEPTATLLARARLRLDAALDRDAQQSGFSLMLHQLGFHAGRLRAAPGLAAAILLLGLAGGFWGGYHSGHAAHLAEAREIVLDPAEHSHAEVVADISRIDTEPGAKPGSDRIEIHYDLLAPQAISGTLDDPSIRRLLVFGLEDGLDPAVRATAIDLLASHCSSPGAGSCDEAPLRAALVRTLMTDSDPRVRLGALDRLAPWVGGDTAVRDAVVHAVIADRNAEVRMEGIRLLTPMGVDSSVRQALHAVAARDGDPLIRSASAEVLAGVPRVQ